MTRLFVARLAGSAVALTLALTACGNSTSATSEAAKAPTFASASAHDIKLTDGWVSAAGMSDMDMGSGSMSGMDMSSGSAMSGMGEATAYATLSETGANGDALVSVTTPAATRVTLHNTASSANGSAGTMVGVSAIVLPAGGHVTLAPGGYHVMLEGLKSDLKVGGKITMTWKFRSGASLTTSFPVIDPTDRPQSDQQ